MKLPELFRVAFMCVSIHFSQARSNPHRSSQQLHCESVQ